MGKSKPVWEEQRCTAKSRSRDGQRCGNWAVKGAAVCRVHGASPAVRAAAARRLEAEKVTRKVQADVAAVIAYEGLAGVSDPHLQLGRLAAEVVAMKDALSSRVNALAELRYSAPGTGAEQIRAEVVLLERAQDRAGKFLDLLIRSGFEERRVKVLERTDAVLEAFMVACGLAGDRHAEQVLAGLLDAEEDRFLRQLGGRRLVRADEETADMFTAVMKAALAALGLGGEQQAAVPHVMPAAIRALSAGEVFVSPVPVPPAPSPDAAAVRPVLEWLLVGFGLPAADPWVKAQVAVAARAVVTGDLPSSVRPPSAWWEQLRDLAGRHVREPVAAIGAQREAREDVPAWADVLEGTIMDGAGS